MRKYNYFCAILLALSILFIGTTLLVKSLQGEKISQPYFRFHKTNNGDTSFNYWSLLFPVQFESQKVQKDSNNFVHRVTYPIAKKFKLEEPLDKSQDTVVANQIAVAVRDSARAPHFKNWCNLDGNSIGVHNYAQPYTQSVTDPHVELPSMTGTASPEAAKYGFDNSILPGNYEKENKILANNRLSRTKNIVINKLKTYDIAISGPIVLHAEEKQLTKGQVDSVRAGHREILDRMRYVDTEVGITREQLIITPITAPVLLPLWIWLIAFLFTRDYRMSPTPVAEKRKAIEPVDAMEDPTRFSWGDLLKILLIVAAIVLAIIYWDYILLVLVGIVTLFLLYVLWLYRKVLYESLRYFFIWIYSGIFWLIVWIRKHWPPKSRPECRRVVIALIASLVLNLIFLISWLFF